MHIFLYSGFQKKPNSTKIPDSSVTKLDLTGYLKEPSSMVNPVFNIKRPVLDFVPNVYNYAYIPSATRYYFITDWIWNDGLWECHCKEDVLASWKAHIGTTSAYVERCAGNASAQDSTPDWDGTIVDKLYPTTTDFTIQETRLSALLNWDITNVEDGCFILGVFGGESNNMGTAVNYWALTKAQMGAFMSYLLSDSFFDNAGFGAITTELLTRNMAKALMNPLQYVVSCMWFPFSPSSVATGSARNIQIGPYNLSSGSGPQGKFLGGTASYTYNVNVSIMPEHPQASSRGSYLKYAPYSAYTLILPPFGTIPIDYSYFDETADELNINIIVDCITGKARLYLGAHGDGLNLRRFFETSAQFGVPIQLAQVANDNMRSNSSIISAVTNNLGAAWSSYSGQVGSAIHQTGMWITSIGDAIEANFPQILTQGINGSFSSFKGEPMIIGRFSNLINENRSELGRPLCAIRTLNTLAGFIKCGEVHIDYGCLEEEEKQIQSFLTTGFFME